MQQTAGRFDGRAIPARTYIAAAYVGGDIGRNDSQGLASGISRPQRGRSGEWRPRSGGRCGLCRRLGGAERGFRQPVLLADPGEREPLCGRLDGLERHPATVNTSHAAGAATGIAGGQVATTVDDYVGGLVGVRFGALTNVYATGGV